METIDFAVDDRCAIGTPTSRRFYVHEGSFRDLMSAQPSIVEELGEALALSGASRAAEQVVEDLSMFGHEQVPNSLTQAVEALHRKAADSLQGAFQCLIHLVPPRFGATEILLGEREEVSAWCYEDGYFTYATDANAARIMYAETGSLRQLRSQVRRSPESDPSLQMISGPSLFLYDQKVGTGSGTAKTYKQQHSRLIRQSMTTPAEIDFRLDGVADTLKRLIGEVDHPVPGFDLMGVCLRRAGMTVDVVTRSSSLSC